MALFGNQGGATGKGQRWRDIGVALAAALMALVALVLLYLRGDELLRQRRGAQIREAAALGRLARQRCEAELRSALSPVMTLLRATAESDDWRRVQVDSPLVREVLLFDGGRLLQGRGEDSFPAEVLTRARALLAASEARSDPEEVWRFDELGDPGRFLASCAIEGEATGAAARRLAAVVDAATFRSLATEGISTDELRVCRGGECEEDPPWSIPLPGSLAFWSIQPTAEAARADTHARWRQALLIGPVSMVSMVALVGLIWRLSRVVREEEQLVRLQSDFVAGVSHELKTPLALIHLFAETLIEGRVATEEKKREYYDIILRESRRLTHLIDNVLDFSKLQSGGKMFELAAQDVGGAIRSIYEAYRHDLDHAGMNHRLSIAEGLPPVALDRDAIGQAVLNLMSNAVKYAEDEKEMVIEVTPDTRRGRHGVLISVQDRGIGIAAEDRAQVFDGFFRANDPRVRQRRGTGLGLSLVRHIVEAHGGSVSVESRLTKGTTFKIFLPAAETQSPPSAAG